MTDHFWRIVAGVLALVLIAAVCFSGIYFVIWPRLQAGQIALTYLNACVQAQVCPTGAMLDERLRKVAEKPPAPTSAPTKPEGK